MATATPNITFTADRTVIQPGEPVTLRWHVEGVQAVYFFADGEDWEDHGVAGEAAQQVRPTQRTTYRLRVVKVDGSVEMRGIEINIQEPSRSLPAEIFSADKTEIQPGECVTFRWHVEGVKEVYFFVEGEDWQGHGVAGVAERQVCPAQTSTYILRVVKADDAIVEHGIPVQVRTSDRVFAADRAWIWPGECVTFRWHVEGVKAVYFHAENQDWSEHGVAGVAEQQVCLDETATYCLRVVKADDALEIHYMTVTVAPRPE